MLLCLFIVIEQKNETHERMNNNLKFVKSVERDSQGRQIYMKLVYKKTDNLFKSYSTLSVWLLKVKNHLQREKNSIFGLGYIIVL